MNFCIKVDPATDMDVSAANAARDRLRLWGLTEQQVKEIEAGAYIAASVALADGRAYFGQYEN